MNVEGIFAVDKPLGITSQRAVQNVKYWARRQTGNKKIKVGHAGTLDPLATGVLVMAVGRDYTKKLGDVVASEKEYIADLKLGEVSETDDAEGKKTVINNNKKPSRDEIESVVQKFIGEIEQTPPIYSAIKIDGQEAYKRVRRGENVEMKKRIVHIEEVEILSYNFPQIQLRIVCGKGTYIRSLARDIGSVLKTGAYLTGLVRTRIGKFVLEDSQNMDNFRMRIAIHATELDASRIDGTRVYISKLLNRFGNMAQEDRFLLYHQGTFNENIAPPQTDNYIIKTLPKSPMWTQTRFALNILKEKPDVLWMPLHNMPFVHSKKTRIVVTIHDLAFKIFPETFPSADVRKLNFLTDYSVRFADKLIVPSKATKKDLLRLYPKLLVDKICVVHHGVNINFWKKDVDREVCEKVFKKYNIDSSQYILHVGAIQPRKNLVFLIKAFEIIKKQKPHLKLVLVGGYGWLWQNIVKHAKESQFAKDIIFTKNIPFEDVQILMKNATVFVLPSLYEGFGIAGLEALAASVPVVAANNSSIPEVLGNAALYFDVDDEGQCADCILKMINNESLQLTMKEKGNKRVQKFTWDKCAKKTLAILRE